MSGYQGMRWLKCDLQVQTPEDARHGDREDPLRLSASREEADLQEKARRYLKRCHEVGLDVIGVTDHNFCTHREPRKRFLAHLIEQNDTVAQELERSPLVIFPGFEVDIGFHVLCLFPPLRNGGGLDAICDVLTELGLSPAKRYGDQWPVPLRRDEGYVSLAEILRVVQEKHDGLVIAAHAFEKNGIAQDATHAEASSLGYRSTWIKMSEPSIEALRQAFLDSDSRIRLEGDPRIVRHSRIESLQVRDVAFLADQEIFFAPGLSCVIGGRGSGKSSLFEYIRFAVRREVEPAAEDKIQRIRSTLTPESVVTLRWREEDRASGTLGLGDTFELSLPLVRARVASREVADPATVFQALDLQILSQGQISALTSDPAFLLPLIDRLVGARLRDLQREEEAVRDRIRTLQQERRSLERLRAEVRELEQAVQEIERRWAARSALQEEQTRYRAAGEAQRYLEDLDSRTEALVLQFALEAIDLEHSPLGSQVEAWPERGFFETLDGGVEKAKQDLAARLNEAVSSYRERIEMLTRASDVWEQIQESLRTAREDFLSACARQGLQPQDLEQLMQLDVTRKAKTLELENKKTQAAVVERRVAGLADLLAGFHDIWHRETATRQEVIAEILGSDAVPKVGQPEHSSVEILVDFSGDRDHFLTEWRELSPDGRFKLGKVWDDLGQEAFSTFRQMPEELASPWEVVEQWRLGVREIPAAWRDILPPLRERLDDKRDLWEAKTLVRIRDGVDLTLYRQDGSEAGCLSRKQLSDGQRNTAILTLLLAQGGGPILIDQPEDELDASFLYEQLVPLLRKIKEERQVIFVTHNPNLPVNADAELVYALAAEPTGERGVRGMVRAQGGLDQAEVKEAVLDIMEGSEQAFRRRREKYHF